MAQKRVAFVPSGEHLESRELLAPLDTFTSHKHHSAPPPVNTYYVAPIPTHGVGTLANPWGIPDLYNPATFAVGPALTTPVAGDTVDIRGGDYHVTTSLTPNTGLIPLLCPANSGTASQPITFQRYPGEIPNFILEGDCVQPLWGTALSSSVRNYIRFLGFKVTVTATHDFGPGETILQPRAFVIGGNNNEIGYCEISGVQVTSFDNHEGIFITFNPTGPDPAHNCWIYHCNIYGFTTSNPNNLNSAGIKVYAAVNLICEDNWIHGNICGVFDKASPNVVSGNIYRRNWLTGNSQHQFRGSNQFEPGFTPPTPALYYIYDNVIDGVIDLQQFGHGHQVYNNLIRTSFASSEAGKVLAIYINSPGTPDASVIYNNIMLGGGKPITSFEDAYNARTTQLSYMDYNVYDNTPDYFFKAPITAATFHAAGFETHAIQDTTANIFVDQTSYVLKPAYMTAGRYGDPVGPRYPIAQIINPARYGPAAMPGSPTPTSTARYFPNLTRLK